MIGATTLGLPRYVAGKLVQPLNKEYLPNFSNVLQSLQSPYYDVGSQYSAPYTVYTTGVAYRRDIIDDSTFAGDDSWKLLWDSKYKGFVGVIDDKREALTLGMYYRGVTDTNTGDPKIIDAAEADVKALVKATDARFDILAYQKIPEGTSHINQAWSGDMVSALQYLPEGTDADVLGYWKPARTTVANDFFVIPARSERPVLAHSLVDFLLDPTNAQQNFEYVGYQPAVQKPTPDDLIAAELVPQTLAQHARHGPGRVGRLPAGRPVEGRREALDGRVQRHHGWLTWPGARAARRTPKASGPPSPSRGRSGWSPSSSSRSSPSRPSPSAASIPSSARPSPAGTR